jgi:predicted phosphodiesterase
VQKFQAVPKTVSKVRGNGDAGSRFDGRNNGRKTVVLFHHQRFLLSHGTAHGERYKNDVEFIT